MKKNNNLFLSKQDLCIMALMFMGYKQTEIANYLEISQSYVSQRKLVIRDYTGARRRIEL